MGGSATESRDGLTQAVSLSYLMQMNICRFLDERITSALHLLGLPETVSAVVKQSVRPEFGDYQANGIMAAAKLLKRNPRELAAALLERVDLSDLAEKVEIAGPGFINIRLKDSWVARQCMQAVPDERVGIAPVAQPHTVVVDYSGPNLAKEMHVGHLRSTIIGDAVARVLEFMGHKVIRQNHVGDWGTQFGMLIAHMVELNAHNDSELSMKLGDLETFYREAKKRFDDSPEFASSAREYVVRLQSGDLECHTLWQKFIDISLTHCEEVYERLRVKLDRSDMKPESSYNDDLANIVRDLQTAGLLTESQGAQCVFLPEFTNKDGSITPIIVQKTDGGYLYATTDLAALRYRSGTLNARRIIYFVDARQALHFQQVFILARKAGFVKQDVTLDHFAFGTMLGDDGKPFKTRTGGTVKLIELLAEAEQRARELLTSKNPDLPNTEQRDIARKVGIGSVKYADLSKNRLSDYVFSWDAMLSLEGNTAPYLQYAYVRIRSIFRKEDNIRTGAPGFENMANKNINLSIPVERALALKLLQFIETLDTVANDGFPNVLCSYLYELTCTFMSFYEACPILKGDIEADVRNVRLALAQLTAQTLITGLDLLGIEVMERM